MLHVSLYHCGFIVYFGTLSEFGFPFKDGTLI